MVLLCARPPATCCNRPPSGNDGGASGGAGVHDVPEDVLVLQAEDCRCPRAPRSGLQIWRLCHPVGVLGSARLHMPPPLI